MNVTISRKPKHFFICLILGISVTLGTLINSQAQSVKNLRSTVIVNTIKDTFAKITSIKNINDPKVKKEVFDSISKFIILQPKTKIRDENNVDYKEESLKLAKKRYNWNDAKILANATKSAEIKYKAASTGNTVTINYTHGGKAFKLTGVLTAISENGISIGSKNIFIYDIHSNYQYLFNTKRRISEKRRFIRESINTYKLKTKLYANGLIKQLIKNDEKSNLKAGYLWYNEAWVSAQSIIDYLIKLEQKNLIAKEKIKNKAELDPDPLNKPKPKNYYKFLKESNKYKQNIASSNSGIDAITGYSFATWGSSLEKVYVLCLQEKYDLTKIKDKTSFRWYPNKNNTQYVTFYFNANKMYKFVITQEFKTYPQLHHYATNVFAYYSYPNIYPTQLDEPMIQHPRNMKAAVAEGKVNRKFNSQQYKWSGSKINANFSIKANEKRFFAYVTIELKKH